MFKKLLCGVLVVLMMASLCGCGNNASNVVENDESSVTEVSGDYMEKYIAKLDSNSEREDFLSFWNSMTSYCMAIEIELREIGNTEKYEFNPIDAGTIPETISSLYDFAEIKFFSGYDAHDNYKMVIDGKKVEFSFDGETFYPTNYGYTDVKTLVDKYNAE